MPGGANSSKVKMAYSCLQNGAINDDITTTGAQSGIRFVNFERKLVCIERGNGFCMYCVCQEESPMNIYVYARGGSLKR